MLSSLRQDIGYAVRMLAKDPGFTLVAPLTLALGIGASTAVFSLVHSVLLRPLPLPASRQLMVLFVKEGSASQEWGAPYPDFEDWRHQSRSFDGLTAFAPQSVNLTGGEQPARIRGAFVSSNFFAVTGVQPSVGRAFEPGEDEPGGAHVAIINYGLWQGRLGADPQILGKSLTLNGEAFTIIGVMPRDFKFPVDSCEVWIPVQYNPHLSRDRAVGSVAILARLKNSIPRQQAQSEMDTIAQRLAQQFPDTKRNPKIHVVPLQDAVNSNVRRAILVLTVAIGFVLLIAFANVESLLLVRASGQHHEMAMRVTLGAAPARLVIQMVTETLMLWFTGAVLGET